jgi:hypothetical protein
MASYGKIATGQKGIIDTKATLSDRSSYIEHQASTDKISEEYGIYNQALTAIGSVSSMYGENKESYENLSTGAKEAGVTGIKDYDSLAFGEKLKIGFGLGDDSIKDLGATYKGDDGAFTTSSLMEIGRKSNAGTLQGSLVGPDGEKKSAWQIYGQKAPEGKYTGEAGNLKENPLQNYGIGDGKNQTLEAGGKLLKAVGIGDGKNQVLDGVSNLFGGKSKSGASQSNNKQSSSSGAFGGNLLESLGEGLVNVATGFKPNEGLVRTSNQGGFMGLKLGENPGLEQKSSQYHYKNLWESWKNKKQVASND